MTDREWPCCGIRDCHAPAYRIGLCKRHMRLLPKGAGAIKQKKLRQAAARISAQLDARFVEQAQRIWDELPQRRAAA